MSYSIVYLTAYMTYSSLTKARHTAVDISQTLWQAPNKSALPGTHTPVYPPSPTLHQGRLCGQQHTAEIMVCHFQGQVLRKTGASILGFFPLATSTLVGVTSWVVLWRGPHGEELVSGGQPANSVNSRERELRNRFYGQSGLEMTRVLADSLTATSRETLRQNHPNTPRPNFRPTDTEVINVYCFNLLHLRVIF